MSHVKLTVNNKVEFDDELTEWKDTPPDFIKDVVKPGFKPEPYLQHVMVAMSGALTSGQDTGINVKTFPDGWAMTVKALKR